MLARNIQTLILRSKTSITTLHQVHGLLLKTSLDHDQYIFSQLILILSSATPVYLRNARKLFDNSPISPPPLFAWNTLIRAYSKNSSTPVESIKLFVALCRTPHGLKPDKFTYPFVIKACGRCSLPRVGGSLHSMVLKMGFDLDSHVGNTLITMYGECHLTDISRKVFDEIRERDVVTWSSMIAAYVDCNLDLDALRMFRDMITAGVEPNLVTLVSLVTACTNLLHVRLGRSAHSYSIVNGIELDVGLGTALLGAYAKSGHLKEASHIFNSISRKNLKSWTVMISCLADHGCGGEAVSLFKKMVESGLRPDAMSFSAVLSACSHSGLVQTGQELFEKMVGMYNILPTVEHYGCMVDLFGRAGKIEEAHEMIMSMPMEPNSVILRSYLSACKHHLYEDKHWMKLLLEIEPDIGANYVLASSEMRNHMKIKGLKKVPGFSWVHKQAS